MQQDQDHYKCPFGCQQKPGLSCLRRWVVPSLFCLNSPPTKRSAPYSELGLKSFSRCSALELKTCKLSFIVCLPLPDTKKLKNGKFVIQVEHAFILSDCHLTQTQWCFFFSFFRVSLLFSDNSLVESFKPTGENY